MDVEVKIDPAYTNPKVVIHTKEITKEISDLVSNLSKNTSKSILGFNNGEIFIINPDDVISIYSENQKILARCNNGIFNLKNRLYELEKEPPSSTFVRISNSEIVNFSKVSSLDTNITGTIILKFTTGEKTFVSRRYMEKIKNYLGV
ncbi:LytTR family DNA-binding domain-containing protein [Clostridium hydrogenum]|uniref:LytTR family DNA-binding domain-containing protein n=1 Tax=Clostridium hydrogenum TaxID=2855764 RepID=UPI002E303152|nr:LytTR family transcriptional regulator DNA-binding domain-containing protein [Clostridium hydrogenum]